MQHLWAILAAGVVLNLFDVGATVAFAARAWTAELVRQGIAPNPWTPPFYVLVNFLGAAGLYAAILVLLPLMGSGVATGIVAAVFMWGVSRIYGAGHVVMRQMPLRIFVIMSFGLGLGYLFAGQIILWLVR